MTSNLGKWDGTLRRNCLGLRPKFYLSGERVSQGPALKAIWEELKALRLQTRADQLVIEAVGDEMEELRAKVKGLRAQLHREAVQTACVSAEAREPLDINTVLMEFDEARNKLHHGGLVTEIPVYRMGEAGSDFCVHRVDLPPLPRHLTIAPFSVSISDPISKTIDGFPVFSRASVSGQSIMKAMEAAYEANKLNPTEVGKQ